jgi:hypothetical protein
MNTLQSWGRQSCLQPAFSRPFLASARVPTDRQECLRHVAEAI